MDKALMCLLAVLLVGGMVLTGCSKSSAPTTPSPRPPAGLGALLKENRGRVLILLLGIEGCPGTARATEGLDGYLSANPRKVSVVRVDVPTPGKTLELTSDWEHKFPRLLDDGRNIACDLNFFYYPTLYVFDGDGVKRYVGGYDKDRMAAMVGEILAEKPGGKKKIYTLPMPAIGQAAPTFSGDTLTGKTVTRNSLLGKRGLLIVFARTSCSFSMGCVPQFKSIADRYHTEGVSVVVVNMQEDLETIKPVYEEQCAGVPVIWDRNGDIGKTFGVDAVPYFFLLDEHGKIVQCGSFTDQWAIHCVDTMLYHKTGKTQFKPGGG